MLLVIAFQLELIENECEEFGRKEEEHEQENAQTSRQPRKTSRMFLYIF